MNNMNNAVRLIGALQPDTTSSKLVSLSIASEGLGKPWAYESVSASIVTAVQSFIEMIKTFITKIINFLKGEGFKVDTAKAKATAKTAQDIKDTEDELAATLKRAKNVADEIDELVGSKAAKAEKAVAKADKVLNKVSKKSTSNAEVQEALASRNSAILALVALYKKAIPTGETAKEGKNKKSIAKSVKVVQKLEKSVKKSNKLSRKPGGAFALRKSASNVKLTYNSIQVENSSQFKHAISHVDHTITALIKDDSKAFEEVSAAFKRLSKLADKAKVSGVSGSELTTAVGKGFFEDTTTVIRTTDGEAVKCGSTGLQREELVKSDMSFSATSTDYMTYVKQVDSASVRFSKLTKEIIDNGDTLLKMTKVLEKLAKGYDGVMDEYAKDYKAVLDVINSTILYARYLVGNSTFLLKNGESCLSKLENSLHKHITL